MESEPKIGGNSSPERKFKVEATVDGWVYPDPRTVPLPPPAVHTIALTPPGDGPHLLPKPSVTTLQETQNVLRSTSTVCGGIKSTRSTNEDSLHAPLNPGAFEERPSTPSPVSQVANRTSIQFVTVIVPLTRLPESILKDANPHIVLPIAVPQLHSPDLTHSASKPSYFEEVSPHPQPVEPSIHSALKDTLHPKAAIPESQTKHVRLCDSSHLKVISIQQDTPLTPSQTTPHHSKASKKQLPTKISSNQPIQSFKRQYKPTPCVFCGKIFARRIFLEDHLRSHIQEVCFECPHCRKGFSKERSYKAHLESYCRVRNKEKCHRCPVCPKSFRTNNSLQVHLKLHSSQRKIHRCFLCPATFKSRRGLRAHEKVKHEKERHKCEECGALLADTSGLRQHMRRHRDIKAHSCLFCDKAFVTNQELFRHLRCHIREQGRRAAVHSCTFCGKKFTRRQHLYCHLCWHIREKWHACNFCGKQFTSKRATLGHIDRCHLGK